MESEIVEEEVRPEQDDLAYNFESVQRGVIMVVISDKKIDKVQFLRGKQDIGVNYDNVNLFTDNLYGHCLKIPLNLDVMSLK